MRSQDGEPWCIYGFVRRDIRHSTCVLPHLVVSLPCHMAWVGGPVLQVFRSSPSHPLGLPGIQNHKPNMPLFSTKLSTLGYLVIVTEDGAMQDFHGPCSSLLIPLNNSGLKKTLIAVLSYRIQGNSRLKSWMARDLRWGRWAGNAMTSSVVLPGVWFRDFYWGFHFLDRTDGWMKSLVTESILSLPRAQGMMPNIPTL